MVVTAHKYEVGSSVGLAVFSRFATQERWTTQKPNLTGHITHTYSEPLKSASGNVIPITQDVKQNKTMLESMFSFLECKIIQFLTCMDNFFFHDVPDVN